MDDDYDLKLYRNIVFSLDLCIKCIREVYTPLGVLKDTDSITKLWTATVTADCSLAFSDDLSNSFTTTLYYGTTETTETIYPVSSGWTSWDTFLGS